MKNNELIHKLAIKLISKFRNRERESPLDPDIVRVLIMIVAIALLLVFGGHEDIGRPIN